MIALEVTGKDGNVKFWNREREVKDLKAYIESEPNAIPFVYGPKSSGKSTLLIRVAREMKGELIGFLWYDLREYAIEKMDDAIAVLLGAKGSVPFLLKLFDINLYVVTVKPDYLNGEKRIADRLFNFFVAVTKVKHIEEEA